MFIRVFRFSWLLGNMTGLPELETARKSLFPEMRTGSRKIRWASKSLIKRGFHG
jgi:hypothetical protein